LKKLVLVAGHFVPSNLASVHRSRLWAQHLREFGWEPILVTTHFDYYEEKLDWALADLVSPDFRVVRTKALPTRPLRVVGDVGIRAFAWHLHALGELARNGEMDFLHITIPSNYSSLLGTVVHRRYGIPFGIDYNDPWVVDDWPPARVRFSKAWFSAKLARVLEPIAVHDAALITGVAPLYYEQVLVRHPYLRQQAVTAAMPYGGSEHDFDAVRDAKRPLFLFDPSDGRFHLLYAGTMWPPAYPILDRLLAGIAHLRARDPIVADKLRVHFVGTGRSVDDPQSHQVMPMAERHGVSSLVDEHPTRISYVDVLAHLQQSSANLIIGSLEPHYTPSKVFQLVQARRPVFAMLHEASTASAFLRESHAGTQMTFDAGTLPEPAHVAEVLGRLISEPDYDAARVRWELLDEYSARASARKLVSAIEAVLDRHPGGAHARTSE
jgi:hypothetical protein